MIEANLMAAGAKKIESKTVGFDFDGNNDYLVKPSQNSGGDMPAISSKTFTMSFYFYKMPLEVASSARTIYTNVDDSGNFFSSRAIWNEISHGIYIGFYGASANSLYLQVPVEKLQPYTFYHVILSVNASTLTAQAYINDEDYSSYFYGIADVVYYLASTNNRNFYVGSASRDALHKGRLAHFYMDTNFVDLSVESNRRIFSDSNGKPGEVSALVGRNPFIYLPFNDPDAPGKNLGVYSDLQAYGSMGASQRGPNQWNCVASEFDGVGDYLSSTGIGAGSSNTVTFSFQVTPDLSSAGDVFGAYDGGSTIGMQLRLVQDGTVSISAQNTSGSYLLGSSNTGSFRFTSGKSHSVQFSVDLSDSTKTVLIVNGSAIPISFFQFLDDVFNLNDSFYVASAGFISNRLNAALGEFYFDTTYIDLATNNPFWDADAGKPKPVLQVLEETGNTPLIAMPIRADDAGRNYGTGGDFTVNPGPFIGARGASEFWARSADFDGSTGYMSRGGLAGAVDSKTFSLCLALKRVDTGTHVIFDSRSSSSLKVLIDFNATNEFNVQMWNHSGTKVFQSSNLNTIVDAGSWFVLQMSVDLSDTAKRSLYINNQQMSPNWSTYINDFIDFTNDASVVGRYGSNSSYYINGDLSFTYFTTDYIDFSQESERLKFVDAFGYPVDIRPKIESGEIPTPLIYMPFDDPNDLGKNLGTGGDFTVNGTVVPGSDVSPA